MPKYTDVQLSRILTAHAQGGLMRGGRSNLPAYPACMNQAAFASSRGGCWGSPEGVRAGEDTPHAFVPHASWFDLQYVTTWTEDELLRWLEARGLA